MAHLSLRSTRNVLSKAELLASARAKSIADIKVGAGVAVRAVAQRRLQPIHAIACKHAKSASQAGDKVIKTMNDVKK